MPYLKQVNNKILIANSTFWSKFIHLILKPFQILDPLIGIIFDWLKLTTMEFTFQFEQGWVII